MPEPFPTAPITWQGRDARGNVVDVTSDVSVVSQPPSIAAESGEQRVRLLSAPISFDTAGVNNPAEDGPLIFTVPAGSLFRVIWAETTAWDQAGSFYVTAGDPSNYLNRVNVAQYNRDSGGHNAWVVTEDVPALLTDGLPRGSVWTAAVQESGVYFSFFPDSDDPTAGAGLLRILIAEPVA